MNLPPAYIQVYQTRVTKNSM